MPPALRPMTVQPIHTGLIPIAEQSLFRLLDQHLPALEERTVLAVTSKLVAVCQGQFLRCDTTDKQALIESEAGAFLPPESNRYWVTLTIKDDRLIPSAGIDESNADGHFILWPSEPQDAANMVRSYLRDRFSRQHVGVVITDSTTAPLRCGVTGIAVAHSGFLALTDYVGAKDVFGRPLRLTKVHVADALATAAVLVMGEGNERTPLAVLTGLPFLTFQDRAPSATELAALRIQPEDDLYAPMLQAAKWKRGVKASRAKNCQTEPDQALAEVPARAR
jgi:putative folate metabolism gamma-glutamate ligase